MFGANSPCWRVEQGLAHHVSAGNNFVMTGPIEYLFFLIQSVTNPVYHFFRISFESLNPGNKQAISLNFCTKPPTSVNSTKYDTQIMCYDGDPSSGQDGQGSMILNAKYIGINKSNPSYNLDVDGTINCTKLKVLELLDTEFQDVTFDDITVSSIKSKYTYNDAIYESTKYPKWSINNNGMDLTGQLTIRSVDEQTINTNIDYNSITTKTIRASGSISTGDIQNYLITFEIPLSSSTKQIIRGLKKSTYFHQCYYSGTGSYITQTDLSQVVASSLKVSGNYGISPDGSVFGKTFYLNSSAVGTDDLLSNTSSSGASTAVIIPGGYRNYIQNGIFSQPSIPNNSSLQLSSMTSTELQLVYPWQTDTPNLITYHNAEFYNFPNFPMTSEFTRDMTQYIEISDYGSIYQIVNVPSNGVYRLQFYYTNSVWNFINNLGVYVDSNWRANLMSTVATTSQWTYFYFDIMLTSGNHIIKIMGSSSTDGYTVSTGIVLLQLISIAGIGGIPIMTSAATISTPESKWTTTDGIVTKAITITDTTSDGTDISYGKTYGMSNKGVLTVNSIKGPTGPLNTDLNIGTGKLTCGTLSFSKLENGSITMTETVGTHAGVVVSGTGASKQATVSGSLIIAHANPGGSSSICFPATGTGGDYGFIEYSEVNGSLGTDRGGRLVIGCANDQIDNIGSGIYGDSIVLKPNENYMGYVGVNMDNPAYPLDIYGICRATTFYCSNNVLKNYFQADSSDGSMICSSFSVINMTPITQCYVIFGNGGAGNRNISSNYWDTSLMRVNSRIQFSAGYSPNFDANVDYYVNSIVNENTITMKTSIASSTPILFTTQLSMVNVDVKVQYWNHLNADNAKMTMSSLTIGSQNTKSSSLNQLLIKNKSTFTGSVFTVSNFTDPTVGNTYGAITSTNILNLTTSGNLTITGTLGAPSIDLGTAAANTLKCGALQVGSTANKVDLGSNAFTTTGSMNASSLNVGTASTNGIVCGKIGVGPSLGSGGFPTYMINNDGGYNMAYMLTTTLAGYPTFIETGPTAIYYLAAAHYKTYVAASKTYYFYLLQGNIYSYGITTNITNQIGCTFQCTATGGSLNGTSFTNFPALMNATTGFSIPPYSYINIPFDANAYSTVNSVQILKIGVYNVTISVSFYCNTGGDLFQIGIGTLAGILSTSTVFAASKSNSIISRFAPVQQYCVTGQYYTLRYNYNLCVTTQQEYYFQMSTDPVIGTTGITINLNAASSQITKIA
jgi:hypothetical protein